MLSVAYLTQLGTAKLNQIRMMRDRGHALPALEATLLHEEAEPMRVIHTFTTYALQQGCSLAEALSGTYAPGPAITQGRAPDMTTVVFLDLQWEDAKRRSKMSSTDQVKSALDAARSVLPTDPASAAASATAPAPAPAPAPATTVVDPVRARVEEARALGVPNVLVISPTPLTPDAKREIMDVGDVTEGGDGARVGESVRVQVMRLLDLFVPIAEHSLVPRHCRLTADETVRFLTECNMHPQQISSLPDNDPVAAYYDYRAGDVIAVYRPGSVEYRVILRDLTV